MRTRRFGRLGWQVSEIGYGAWQIGGNMWGDVSERSAEEAIEAALDAGITFFDTALAYGRGRSEQVLGGVLARTGMRDKVRVATKVPPMDWEWPANHSSKLRDIFPAHWIRECTEKSISSLGFAPDLQQLHVWSDSWVDDDEWYDELSALKQEGKLLGFGVSINDHEPESALKVTRSGKVDTLQLIYNIFDQSPEKELLPLAQEKDVAVIVRVPLDEGSLGGKYTRDTKFPEGDVRASYFRDERLAQTVERVERLRPLLEHDGQTLAQGALRFCLSHDAVSTVIAGSVNPDHIRANAAVSDAGKLDEKTRAELKQHAWHRNFYD